MLRENHNNKKSTCVNYTTHVQVGKRLESLQLNSVMMKQLCEFVLKLVKIKYSLFVNSRLFLWHKVLVSLCTISCAHDCVIIIKSPMLHLEITIIVRELKPSIKQTHDSHKYKIHSHKTNNHNRRMWQFTFQPSLPPEHYAFHRLVWGQTVLRTSQRAKTFLRIFVLRYTSLP